MLLVGPSKAMSTASGNIMLEGEAPVPYFDVKEKIFMHRDEAMKRRRRLHEGRNFPSSVECAASNAAS
jgi:hypothetical protein